MAAAVGGTVSVVRYLRENGADLNARDKDGNTALIAAEAEREKSPYSDRDEIIQVL